MKKLTLVGVSYDIHDIEGLDFLIPSHLQRFEKNIEANSRDAVLLLKEKGWYNYVLMADMVIVVAHSPRHGKFGGVRISPRRDCRPVFFVDSGAQTIQAKTHHASTLVHEATHVHQRCYLSKQELGDQRTKEVDACREEVRLLRRCGDHALIAHTRNWLKQKRGWWECLDSGPTTKAERYSNKRNNYYGRIYDELLPHILF